MTDRIIKLRINKGDYTKDLIKEQNKMKDKNVIIKNNSSKFLFSLWGEGKLKETFINLINSANRTIFFINWLFVDIIERQENRHSSKLLIDNLIETTKRLRGNVFIITAPKDARIFKKNKRYYDRHLEILNILEQKGAFIKGYENAHGKLLIVDEKIALLTSANYTKGSLTTNTEIGIIIDEPEVVEDLTKMFRFIWTYVANTVFSNKKFRGYQPPKLDESLTSLSSEQHDSTTKVLTTYKTDMDHYLPNQLYSLINKAKKEITIVSYSFTNLEEISKNFSSLLHRKLEENVSIELIVNLDLKNEYKLKSGIIKTFGNKTENLRIFVDKNIHSKLILIDQKELLIFTGNLDKYLFCDKSLDFGVITQDKDIVNEAILFVNLLRKKVRYKYNYKTIDLNPKLEKKYNQHYVILVENSNNVTFSSNRSSPLSLEDLKDLLEKNTIIVRKPKFESSIYWDAGDTTLELSLISKQDHIYKLKACFPKTKEGSQDQRFIPIQADVEIFIVSPSR